MKRVFTYNKMPSQQPRDHVLAGPSQKFCQELSARARAELSIQIQSLAGETPPTPVPVGPGSGLPAASGRKAPGAIARPRRPGESRL
ncbi:hypothetical protein Salmuc_03130 [Salipiger mucosus DSM 16094]|uniref:Uncharacterized protein n=1 Tax=Salipiger mucosus DSM 16094 TaxID=1123237 RepID=S9Q894_9RHOB|nr:hypothetical protein Salmuc_03130 [Salipiger mucosus DSM 16094]